MTATTITIVCLFNRSLLQTFRRRNLIVKIDSFSQMEEAAAAAKSENHLVSLWLRWQGAVSDIPFESSWASIPLTIYAGQFGEVHDILDRVAIMKTMRMRIFISSDDPNAVTGIKILASMGIPSGIYFGAAKIQWDKMNDLMHYALLSNTAHASVEPFRSVYDNYKVSKYTELGGAYFDDPQSFLHVDPEGTIALTEEEMIRGKFVGKGIDSIDSLAFCAEVQQRLQEWRKHIETCDQCSFCPGFRICGGRFEGQSQDTAECKEFFSDFIDTVELVKSKNKARDDALWR
jgi:hypothetical protein